MHKFYKRNEDIKADSPLWLPTSTHSRNLPSHNPFISYIISIKPQTALPELVSQSGKNLMLFISSGLSGLNS